MKVVASTVLLSTSLVSAFQTSQLTGGSVIKPFAVPSQVLLRPVTVDSLLVTNSRREIGYLRAREDDVSENFREEKGSLDNIKKQTTSNSHDSLTGVHPLVRQGFSQMKQMLKNSGITQQKALSLMAAAVFMLVTIFTPLQDALAATSGGRMGGSFGGSSRSRAPMTRSYSSGSYSRGFSQGYSSGYMSRPSIGFSPFGYYSPFYAPPIIAPGVGVGVISRGPSIFDVFFFGVFAWVLLQVATTFTRPSMGRSTFFDSATGESVLGRGVSVAQVTIALNVPNRDDPNNILSFLSRLSQTANTDSRVGVSNLVSQVALELLRQRRSIFAANTTFQNYKNGDEAQRNYNNLAVKERSKFERETVNKYGGVDYYGRGESSTSSAGLSRATVAVVTILIAIDGDSTKIPRISSIGDVEKALTMIASDVKADNCLRSAEILWTPEQREDSLSERDAVVDYPELRNI